MHRRPGRAAFGARERCASPGEGTLPGSCDGEAGQRDPRRWLPVRGGGRELRITGPVVSVTEEGGERSLEPAPTSHTHFQALRGTMRAAADTPPREELRQLSSAPAPTVRSPGHPGAGGWSVVSLHRVPSRFSGGGGWRARPAGGPLVLREAPTSAPTLTVERSLPEEACSWRRCADRSLSPQPGFSPPRNPRVFCVPRLCTSRVVAFPAVNSGTVACHLSVP